MRKKGKKKGERKKRKPQKRQKTRKREKGKDIFKIKKRNRVESKDYR